MTGPLGYSEFCFPRISMFPETKSRETLRFTGNKTHCSPPDQLLSVKYFTCEARDNLNSFSLFLTVKTISELNMKLISCEIRKKKIKKLTVIHALQITHNLVI